MWFKKYSYKVLVAHESS